jgi:hypothetical protein
LFVNQSLGRQASNHQQPATSNALPSAGLDLRQDRLQSTGLGSTARIPVPFDRKLLEEQSCECYSAAVMEYEKTFGFTPRTKTRVTPVD